MTPVWIGLRVLKVCHQAIFFWGWCDGVMDSARYFDLPDESVLQVRVSARALALLGFVNFNLLPSSFSLYTSCLSSLEGGALNRLTGCPLGSAFNWRKVWTGVKCHFSSTHHHNQYVVGKLSISRVWMWNFTQIGRKTKKLRLSINPARRQWPGTTHKKVWTTTFFTGIQQAIRRWKALDLGSWNMQFQKDWPKD